MAKTLGDFPNFTLRGQFFENRQEDSERNGETYFVIRVYSGLESEELEVEYTNGLREILKFDDVRNDAPLYFMKKRPNKAYLSEQNIKLAREISKKRRDFSRILTT